MKKTLISAYIVGGLVLVALVCVVVYTWPRPTLNLPEGFVEVEAHRRGRFEQRAVAADGTVIGLRRQNNPENGSLKFWDAAIKRELTEGRGYRIEAEEEVKSDAGKTGRLMEFTTESLGKEAAYGVALFVTDGQVLVAEAGGSAEAMKSRADEIRKCLLTAR